MTHIMTHYDSFRLNSYYLQNGAIGAHGVPVAKSVIPGVESVVESVTMECQDYKAVPDLTLTTSRAIVRSVKGKQKTSLTRGG